MKNAMDGIVDKVSDLISSSEFVFEKMVEMDETICALCIRLNPQHKDCYSCDDRRDILDIISENIGCTKEEYNTYCKFLREEIQNIRRR